MSVAINRQIVGIIDYQAGNIHSLQSAFEHIGAKVERVTTVEAMASCTHLVLPGVGAFGFCARRLDSSGLVGALRQWALEDEKPLLGICVGMQLLADSSDESPDVPGLGWLGGKVEQMRANDIIHVPHVGWNSVEFKQTYGEFNIGESADFYFDHSFSFGIPDKGDVLADCLHGATFTSAIKFGSITAAQFHPEKSQTAGLKFLECFLTC